MLCDIQYKKVEVDYSQYSRPIRLGCPFCIAKISHKTRTYKSLKSLLYHLSDQHQNEGNYYPFMLNDVKAVMQIVAVALEWGLLV